MSIFNKIFKPQKFTSRDNSTFLDVFGDTEGMYRQIKTKQDIVWAYKFCPTIRAIIDRKAELFSNFVLKEMRGEIELQNTPFLNIMQSPHPFYSENEFFQTLSKQWDLFGEVFIWKISNNINAPLKNGDKLLILPAQNVHVEVNENYDLRFDELNFIKYYELDLLQKTYRIEPYEIIHITKSNSDLKSFFESDKNIYSLEGAINSITAGYNVRNTLLNRNGGFGIFTNDIADGGLDFNRNIESEEIESLQKDLKKYSFRRKDYNYIITNAKLRYQAITYPIAEMQVSEAIKQAKIDICDVLNYPILALNEMEGSTFSNMEIADKKIYTDSIIPSWKLFEKALNQENLTLNEIVFDYSNINALLTDETAELNNTKLNDEVQINRYKEGLITLNEMRLAIGLEEVPNGDNFYTPTNNFENDIQRQTV
jgi:hypothetical protein